MSSIIVRSLMLKAEVFQKLEIEIQLVPGLPTIQFLGLPSPGLKESALRIRSALRASGFKLPKGRQILVDIRPRDEKKHGRGVDLAVAAGYLMLSDQWEGDRDLEKYFYGDLGLGGDVMAPPDWPRVRALLSGKMMTGLGPEAFKFRGGRRGEGIETVSHLREISRTENLSAKLSDQLSEPQVQDNPVSFEVGAAEVLSLAAVGGHSLLLAGPQGTGKSTLARWIHRLRTKPTVDELCEIETWSGEPERPLVEPHHTASEFAMVGGRQPPRPGAITRAHLGTLLMDEVLLFRPEVQEALREPLETGVVHLARGPEARKFPADFQLLGTTNLCECGMYTPVAEDMCQCSSRVRARFESRLRGPFIDRFQMMAFTNGWSPAKGRISFESLRDKILEVRDFQISSGRMGPNRHWRPTSDELSRREKEELSKIPELGSERRRLSVQRVARTWADLELRREISAQDIFRARKSALDTFVHLRSLKVSLERPVPSAPPALGPPDAQSPP